MQRIAVIDYGMGNLRSVSRAIEHVAPNDQVIVTADADTIHGADRIVCPGQGAALACMQALGAIGMVELIKDVIGQKPFLGICMGYQVLFEHSDENGGVPCLGYFPGHVEQFASPLHDQQQQRLKVPHMGWSEVDQVQSHPLWQGIESTTRFYFAHSYYCQPANAAVVAGMCNYGHPFAAAVAESMVFACQFHPEKSGQAGLRLLENFVQWS